MKKDAKGKIKVLLADDHLVVRMGIASLLSFEEDIEVVGEVCNGLDAVRAARVAHPERPLVVSLAEGAYPVTEMVTLSLVDSGTPSAPVTWRGEGRGAVFSGAVPLGPWREGRAPARPI